MLRSLAVWAAVVFTCPALALEARLPRHPAPSPDGREIAFSWQGDIWIAPATGGPARRFTTHPAADRRPVWSRDGRWLAFASDRHGQLDVFVAPTDGAAAPRRLTYASVDDTPVDFTPDGSAVLFVSRRDESVLRTPALYTVPVTGGTARLVQHALGHWASFSPDGRRLAFVRGGTPWTRHGYRGSANRELWLRDEDGAFRQLTTFDGDDDHPAWIDDRTLVYLSERAGRKNLFVSTLGGEPRPLTAHENSDVRFPRASANGALLAYEYEDAIWTVATPAGSPRRLSIDVPADQLQNTVERGTATSGATELAIAPDGKTAALVVGGDVFVVAIRSKDDQDIAPPPTIQITATPAREKDVAWSPDGKSLLFASARGGDLDLFAARRADEAKEWVENFEFPVERLTATPAEDHKPTPSPDGKRIAFVRGKGDLWVMASDGKDPKLVAPNWSPPDFEWSPDSQWIALSNEDPHGNPDIFIVAAAGGELFNVSRHPGDDVRPAWTPDGRRLLWLSRRHANSLDVWSVWLTREDHERTPESWLKTWKSTGGASPSPAVGATTGAGVSPPGAASDAKAEARAKSATPPADPKTSAKSDAAAPPPVRIDFDRLWERAAALTELRGDERLPRPADGGRRILFTAEPEGERDLYSIRWDGKDVKRLTTGGKAPSVIAADAAGATVFLLDKNGAILRVGLDGKAGDPTPFAARFEVDLVARRGEVFGEAWRAMSESFYDPGFHGVDWAAQREKHRPWALAASTPEDFADVVNLMLGELNSSHQGYRPKARENVEATGWIGALFEPASDPPGVRVREVLDDSPAARTDVRLAPGERILAVNNRSVLADLDIYSLFADTVGRPTALRVQGEDGVERTVVLTPVNFDAELDLRRAHWAHHRRRLVEELSGGKLGYLHIPSMDMPSFEDFVRDLYIAGHGKEGLIIDVRSNGGGWTTDYLMAALGVQRHAYTVSRDAPADVKAYPQDRLPIAAWTRPALALCNAESYSNAEIFSFAFQTLKRGKLVGERTFGAVISTGATTLLDGATLRLPTRGWYVAGSGLNMENNGAQPDLPVAQPPEQDIAAGHDAQLERAVAVFLEELPRDPRRGAW